MWDSDIKKKPNKDEKKSSSSGHEWVQIFDNSNSH